MGLAFAFLFPVGAIIIRTASFRGAVYIHAATQAFAYALAIVGFGLGIYIAVYPESQIKAGNGHPIIGIVVIGCLLFQPISGVIHHYIYKKHGKRSFWTPSHVWWGRVIITLGMINGGLGLQLSGDTIKGEIAYGVIAGFMWLLWVSVIVWSSFKSKDTVRAAGEKFSPHSSAMMHNVDA
ncbi:hypothetical protein MMC21_005499 [Puttea exsequens]|nr:hypothetical protein [Puttea exsequens]